MPYPTESARVVSRTALGVLLLILLSACGDPASVEPAGKPAAPKTNSAALTRDAPDLPQAAPTVFGVGLDPFHGDFSAMQERRIIRVLVGYSQTHFFLDGLTTRGISADGLKEFEKFLKNRFGTKRPTLITIPVARDQMIDYLEQGLADLAVGNLTITPERLTRVAFSVPLAQGVSEVLVTGAGSPPLRTLDDLQGQEVFIRASSSFRESVESLNAGLVERGHPPVGIVPADENLQTEDILELVNAGVVDITIADSHIAGFWEGVLPDITVRNDLVVTADQAIGWAIRKTATGFKAHVDDFVKANRKGTLVGNVIFKRYLQNEQYIRNAGASEDRQRLLELAALFRRYSDRYSFDWLLIAAQGYQESRLIHSTRSQAGAVGVMQILPRTARSPVVGISDVEDVEANIHAGHKYLRHIIDHYFADPAITEFNRNLLGFAAYNAGPTRINQLRRLASERGLDPNVWFGNVELLVAEQVGREPVQYVRNILKYYTTYSMLREKAALGEMAAAGPDA